MSSKLKKKKKSKKNGKKREKEANLYIHTKGLNDWELPVNKLEWRANEMKTLFNKVPYTVACLL